MFQFPEQPLGYFGPVYVRHVDSSPLGFSPSSHRHSYRSCLRVLPVVLALSINNKQTLYDDYKILDTQMFAELSEHLGV